MEFSKKSRATYGMEIEQFSEDVPRAILENHGSHLGRWHHDESGPRETDTGAFKHAKACLNRFFKGTQDVVGAHEPWEWKAANGGPGEEANAAGSHVHVHLMVPDDADREEKLEAWTIFYNTFVELLPFFTPFFCHNWHDGLRNGTRPMWSHGESNAHHYATPVTVRKAQSSMRDQVLHGHGMSGQGSFPSLRWNTNPGKPFTVEIRLNDAHPTMALAGVKLLKRLAIAAIKRGESPKIDYEQTSVLNRNRGFARHSDILEDIYDIVYPEHQDGLIEDMKQSFPIVFEEERGIPDVDGLQFNSVWDVLDSILDSRNEPPGRYDRRIYDLVQSGTRHNSPHLNGYSLWDINAERGEFMWRTAPFLLNE